MITFDKAREYAKRYYFKIDKDSGERKLYDMDNREFVPDGVDTTEIRASLSVFRAVRAADNEYTGFITKPYNTDEEKLEWEREQAIILQKKLIKIIDSGKYELQILSLSELYKIHTIDEDFFKQLSNTDKNQKEHVENGKNLLQYLCDSRGKKLSSFNINKELKAGGLEQIITASFSTREKTIREKLNPKSPQYTQPNVKKELTPEQKANRCEFAENLVKYYLMAESDEMYKQRVSAEEGNMKFVANTINRSREINSVEKDVSKLARLLLAAKNISLDGQTDYFEQIIAQPSINQALVEIKKSNIFDKIKAKAERNEQNGVLINGKPQGHHETKGELENRISNSIIQRHPNAVDTVKNKLNRKSKMKIADSKNVMIFSMVARIQGKLPSYTQNCDGTFDFNSDEARSK